MTSGHHWRLTGGLVLAALLLLAASFSVMGATTGEQKIFRFNVSPDGYPPYLITQDGQPSGILWDVVSLICERLNYRVVPVQIPRKRVDGMLLDGYFDGTSRAIEWTDSPDKFLFTRPIVDIEQVLFTPADSERIYDIRRGYLPKNVVTHLGYYYPDLDPYFRAGTVRRFDVPRERDLFTFLVHGKGFDAAITDRRVGLWILRNENLEDKVRVARHGLRRYGYRLMLRKDWVGFARRFNKELQHIRRNGELDAILQAYR